MFCFVLQLDHQIEMRIMLKVVAASVGLLNTFGIIKVFYINLLGSRIAQYDYDLDSVDNVTAKKDYQNAYKLQALRNELPWLTTVLNETNETITLSNGCCKI